MKLAIVGDIHSNFEALNEVIKFIKREKVDGIFVCGDIIGYGPDPELCVEKIFSVTDLIVKGNHEQSIIRGDYSGFRERAKISLQWTERKVLRYIEWFKKLPEKITFENMVFVHGGLSDPVHKYIIKKEDAEVEFKLLENFDICFFAHTHIPFAFRKKRDKEEIETLIPEFDGTMKIEIDDKFQYLINVGSCGYPRDGFPMACVSIYDTEKKYFYLERINYPVEITRNKIISRGLPSSIAEKIYKGI